MIELLKNIIEGLQHLDAADRAKLSAYWLAPGSILLFAASGFFGSSFAIDLSQPIAVAELRSEVLSTGIISHKPGFAVIVEPVVSEFRIPLQSTPSGVWTSLDESGARANSSRLAVDAGGISGRAPFLGTVGPVTIVVEGELGPQIQVPGGMEKVDDLLLRSRRSVSVLTSVLIACVFAFGMTSASGLSPVHRN
jgi:hypothetical protein